MTNSNIEERSAYDLVIALVKEHGGSMTFQRKGHSTGGTWVIEVAGMKNTFPCYKHRFPGLDELYMPKPGLPPKTFNDYNHELLPDAWEKLNENMRIDWIEYIEDLEWLDQKRKRKDLG